MGRKFAILFLAAALFGGALRSPSQVFSPKVLTSTQVDTTDLSAMVKGIYRNAHAVTDREKAEAIWRFFLTDGRFVKPGIFYHIPGWAYEEPMGEVLDPIKLVNTYGFGLCYQDAPLLQAVWKAGGFKYARVWFLTGHTVAEVFYDGQYHYYDSDMMGYTTLGSGSFKTSQVASVSQISSDRSILLGKLDSPTRALPGAVDAPWYNADVRAGAIGDLADLFSTTADNYVYAFDRYSQAHTMDFVLRPGERMVRYYNQPDPDLRYLPYETDGREWHEFTKDYNTSLLVKNGPKSEKDSRRWSTGYLEYRPNAKAMRAAYRSHTGLVQAEYSMPSPYVIIGAKFSMALAITSADESISVETSTDDGHTWTLASTKQGPFSGAWEIQPGTVARSEHGTLNAVSGSYGYKVRLTLHGTGVGMEKKISGLMISTTFELNPRTLPVITSGANSLRYESSDLVRTELPVHAANAEAFAIHSQGAVYESEKGQGYFENSKGRTGELIFELTPSLTDSLIGFDAGGRFLDLRQGLAPDKLTAEVRKVAPWPARTNEPQHASISWSLQKNGPWATLWTYDSGVSWPDHQPVQQLLRWPEVDRKVRDLQGHTTKVFVRYGFENLALDDVHLATIERAPETSTKLIITHQWTQDGQPGEHTESFEGRSRKEYRFDLPLSGNVLNQALILQAQ